MCVTADKAHLSRTIVYAGKTRNGLHVMGYQNTVVNLAPGPNAMLLHIPSEGMTPDMLVDTRGCRRILRDMADAVVPRDFALLGGVTREPASVVHVFDFDVFTIVLATNSSLIPEALERVPADRRVSVSPEQAGFYASRWPRWSTALCCFNNRDAAEAAPIVWAYPPLHPDLLFACGVDDHRGRVPDIGAPVERDHTIIFGAPDMRAGEPVYYSDDVPGYVAEFLPSLVVGGRLEGERPNTDFVAQVSDIEAGRFRFVERLIGDAA